MIVAGPALARVLPRHGWGGVGVVGGVPAAMPATWYAYAAEVVGIVAKQRYCLDAWPGLRVRARVPVSAG